MSTLGLKEEIKRPVPETPLVRQVNKEMAQYEAGKAMSKAVVSGTLTLSFLIFMIFADKASIVKAVGGVIGVLIIAGIPSVIAAKFKLNWRPVWVVFAALALISHVTMYYRSKNPQTSPPTKATSVNYLQ